MEYKELGNTGLKVSTIGLGCEHIGEDFKTTDKVIRTALDGGINFLDVFMAGPTVRSNIGKSLKKVRKDVVLQGHLGAVMVGNQPTQSRELNLVKQYFEDFMERMGTDYVDIGYLHFIDKVEDYHAVVDGGVLEYAQKLKENGTIRAIGLSTHYAPIALEAVKNGIVDCIMFPINAAFDFMPKQQNIFDIFSKEAHHTEAWFCMEPARQELYTLCQNKHIPIISMKPLGGGMMLQSALSPFGCKMSVHQCVNYALTNPAVATAMVGCQNRSEVHNLLKYYSHNQKKNDYTLALSQAKIDTIHGKCTYCNHCLPCPEEIDIAAVMKLKDIAQSYSSPQTSYAAEHYRALKHTAMDCIACGACVKKCPFGVDVIAEMNSAKVMFGQNK